MTVSRRARRRSRLHAGPPPSWLARILQRLNPNRRIITSGLTWWQIALRWLTDWWCRGW